MTTPLPEDPEFVRRLLFDMVRIRRMEEKAAELYGTTKIRGFLHLYVGEEAVAVGALHALRPQDNVVATYREHGHALVRGVSMNAIMAEMFGKSEGCSRGRGGSMHLFDADTRFFGGNAIVAGGLPIAVGLALADKMQDRQNVTVCFFGDGAVAEGAFHESMNLAALWHLPVLFCCENNLYAMGTAIDRAQSQTDLCAKAASFKVPTLKVDGMDVFASHAATATAAGHVREGSGPFFVEYLTYRFRAHSMFDPELYRDKAEVEEWKKRDPIDTCRTRLEQADIVSARGFAEMQRQADDEVDAAVGFAEAGTWEDVGTLERDVMTSTAESTVGYGDEDHLP
ncbi:pyruvate dehydrogenase (acetyl-transferring) E1 component subunit alpha [Rhodococcus sp. WMMA185]|uniref:pyruvate dehydrogenase (acetyl-transferring) E1 component subunit alpha n=1 Tax=Rhodococcus sp. WMMA185 TaxID=679318 RepID=UPI000878EE3D|nr:pyruvate dehydrogenase (acetyl-transferring) E1 component subunit alpha [Rhodococcus sp. WMMA185]AOW93620.1 pyruvate dehydrogenase (acetyl-transferring) E1 component subunit alpha [Rhodococcus sp. WMMA185]